VRLRVFGGIFASLGVNCVRLRVLAVFCRFACDFKAFTCVLLCFLVFACSLRAFAGVWLHVFCVCV